MTDVDVLLIEDDTVLGGALQQRLQLEGISVRWAQSGAQALELLRRLRMRPAFVLADIRLPDGSGETLYRHLIPYLARATVVFATAYGDIAQAVRLVAAGANDYLTKPYDTDALVERIRVAIAAAAESGAAGGVAENPFAQGESGAALALQIERLGGSSLPLLLEGETGVGKDMAARYIHSRSRQGLGPFVALNCATLTEGLVESQLFGHARGAFSGAGGAREGIFAQAGEGTLFLDEVADLVPKAQAVLVRVLEEGRYTPLGAAAAQPAPCRILASSQVDLEQAVAQGRFRADLYFRLAVGQLRLPPLRQRQDALLPLARCLLREQPQGAVLSFDAAAERALSQHDWPGNVRELKNRIARAAVMADGQVLSAADLFPETRLGEAAADLGVLRAEAELRAIQHAIAESGGQMGQAAKLLGISRTTLWKKLRAARER